MGQKLSKEVAPIFRYVNRASDFLATLTAMTIFVVVMIQIIGRLISHSAPWTEEATRLIFIWMIFLGIGIGFRRAESPRVTVLLDKLPLSIKKFSRGVYIIGTTGFFVFMFVYGIDLMRQQIHTNEMSTVLMMPMWIIGLSIPVSAFLGIINTVQTIIYDRNLI
ncbi:TRAP transporter small permease [Alkalihalobacillus oceani]|uniref:TRAP transporter small permease n=1 Tax=Halalkalibacter oceani TaxID=1653776 RepID=UPI00203AED83|nr:TRAP transporter small permease [Halalkalibacter oceani]MCM3761974.1 TRAP transporter small permease [Halalkalibacter oceani]